MKRPISNQPRHLETGAGLPLLMVPGMEGSRWFWRYQLEELGGQYRAIACDLARRSPSLASTVADYAAEVLSLMDELALERAVLVGESFGGVVVQHLALAHPDRVLALVLCNTLDRPRPGGFGVNLFTLATLAHFGAVLAPGLTRAQRKRALDWVGRHRGFVMDPSPGNAALADHILDYGTACGAAAYADRLIAGLKVRHTERLGQIRAPTLVLSGSEDRVVLADTADELRRRIPGAELVVIQGGGHCCPHTLPRETNAAIGAWLQRQDLSMKRPRVEPHAAARPRA